MRPTGGFSLVEVVAALALVGCLFIALASLEIVTHHASRNMHTLVLARQVCEDQLSRVRQDIGHVPPSSAGVTREDATDFRWSLVVTDVPVADLKNALVQLEITCTWTDEAGPRTLVQKTMLALPEVVHPPPSPAPGGAPSGDETPQAGETPKAREAPDGDASPNRDEAPQRSETP